MSKTSLILAALVGLSLGAAGSFGALAERVAKRNASLTCQPWQVRDDYRSFPFGKVQYCRDLPTKTLSW